MHEHQLFDMCECVWCVCVCVCVCVSVCGWCVSGCTMSMQHIPQ